MLQQGKSGHKLVSAVLSSDLFVIEYLKNKILMEIGDKEYSVRKMEIVGGWVACG
jgi:hypothetical protein